MTAAAGIPTSEVLARFRASGSRLVLLWWGFAFSAIAFAPAVVLLSGELRGADATLLGGRSQAR